MSSAPPSQSNTPNPTPGSGPGSAPLPPQQSRVRRAKDWFSGLSEAGKIALIGAVITTVGGGAFGVINAVIPVLAGSGKDDKPEKESKPSAQAPKTPGRSPFTSSHPSSDPTTPMPLARQCTGWSRIQQAFVDVMPCIGHDANGVTISVKVKAIPQDGTPNDVTVWLWLMHQDRKMIKNRTFQLTRNESTLHRCQIHLDNEEQVEPCGPYPVATPTKEGQYSTSVQARTHSDSAYPPGWDDPKFAGTQGGRLLWPADQPNA